MAVLSTPVFHVEHAFVSISLLESEDLQMNSDMTVDSELNSVSPLSFMELALQQVTMKMLFTRIFIYFIIRISFSSSNLLILMQAKFALKNLEVPVG